MREGTPPTPENMRREFERICNLSPLEARVEFETMRFIAEANAHERQREEAKAKFGVTEVCRHNGRYVPAQPHPLYDWKLAWRRFWLCDTLDKHEPGRESQGWFCARCLKPLKK